MKYKSNVSADGESMTLDAEGITVEANLCLGKWVFRIHNHNHHRRHIFFNEEEAAALFHLFREWLTHPAIAHPDEID